MRKQTESAATSGLPDKLDEIQRDLSDTKRLVESTWLATKATNGDDTTPVMVLLEVVRPHRLDEICMALKRETADV